MKNGRAMDSTWLPVLEISPPHQSKAKLRWRKTPSMVRLHVRHQNVAALLQPRLGGTMDMEHLVSVARADNIEPGLAGQAFKARHDRGASRSFYLALGESMDSAMHPPEPLSLWQAKRQSLERVDDRGVADGTPDANMAHLAHGHDGIPGPPLQEILGKRQTYRGEASAAHARCPSHGQRAPEVVISPDHQAREETPVPFRR